MVNKLWTEIDITVEHTFLVNIYSSRIESVLQLMQMKLKLVKDFIDHQGDKKQEGVSKDDFDSTILKNSRRE